MAVEYWYQRVIRNFSHFQRILLSPSASVAELLRIAFKDRQSTETSTSTTTTSTGNDSSTSAQEKKIDADVKEAVELLVSKADMLEE